MNWVERRAARERHLRDSGSVWVDVYTAIVSAVESFNQHYRTDQSKVELGDTEKNSHIQVLIPPASGAVVRIDVNLAERKIQARYSNGRDTQNFQIDADHESPYVKCRDTRCTPDEVSRLILEPLFFPSTVSRTGAQPGRLL
jgi:hypothetical protein